MAEQDDVRRLALAQPEAVEQPHFESASFRVRGKMFATLHPDGVTAALPLPVELAAELVDREAPAVSAVNWGSIRGWVRLDLPALRPGLLEQLVPAAWGRVAPKRLAREQAA
jgi:hypothetical protein